MEKDLKQAVKAYNLIDDEMFTKAAESKAFCQEILRTVCEDPGLIVLENFPQHKEQNLNGRSVIFDAKCTLSDGKVVDIEVQKSNNDDHQKRVRYNGAILTTSGTHTGSRFKDIPDVCIVFISKFDPFKSGKSLYHVDRIVRETGEKVENGFSEIYVNAKSKDGTKVSELMKIFVETDAYNIEMFPEVSKIKQYYKEESEGEKKMSEIGERIRKMGIDEGIAIGRDEGIAHGVAIGRNEGIAKGKIITMINILKKTGVSIEELLDMSGIQEKEKKYFRAELEKSISSD